jgi:hypothetical protein
MNLMHLLRKAVNTVVPNAFDLDFQDIIEAAKAEAKNNQASTAENKVYNERVKPLDGSRKIEFLVFLVNAISDRQAGDDWTGTQVHLNFLQAIIKSKLVCSDTELLTVLDVFQKKAYYGGAPNIFQWPIASWLSQVERQVKTRSATPELVDGLNELANYLQKQEHEYRSREKQRLVARVQMLIDSVSGSGSVRPAWFAGNDGLSHFVNDFLRQRGEEAEVWFQIIQHAQKASGAAPSSKYLEKARQLASQIGVDIFSEQLAVITGFAADLKNEIVEHSAEFGGRMVSYSESRYLDIVNVEALRGLVWMGAIAPGRELFFQLAALAERAYEKVPGSGPVAPALGNACFYVLANNISGEGINMLSRLRLRIRQNSAQTLIVKYLNASAKASGKSLHDIEDLAVEEYRLSLGVLHTDIEGFRAVIKVLDPGDVSMEWFRPDGKPQKAVPSIVKDNAAEQLRQLKKLQKAMATEITVQRDRIDRMMCSAREMHWEHFLSCYFDHGLMSVLARRIIWVFSEAGKETSAIWHEGQWADPDGPISFAPGANTMVRIWHPVGNPVEAIRQWRSFLLDHAIAQPMKQAFREVYLITDAEINTRLYSNRMAAHLLKQHQFNSLAKLRSWKYSLMGAYDDGRSNEAASFMLGEYGLEAQFWVNEVNTDDGFNASGIWHYVATDQVRFVRNGEPVELLSVPALAFSEVMRDVDLFVGVASVGNDPLWRDNGGVLQYQDYWQRYSFGDLSEVAKTRKELLGRLLPRLKIAPVAEIRDRFLRVQGKLRAYKIHLGSTNILMEPNDEYLCIVPDRTAKPATSNLFLPFEGDNGVSIILSKAFLLAADDKITDESIISQIRRS